MLTSNSRRPGLEGTEQSCGSAGRPILTADLRPPTTDRLHFHFLSKLDFNPGNGHETHPSHLITAPPSRPRLNPHTPQPGDTLIVPTKHIHTNNTSKMLPPRPLTTSALTAAAKATATATKPSTTTTTTLHQQIRCLHANIPPARIPKPTPFVPDPTTFLTLIGRDMSKHAAKIPTWDALFSLTSAQLRESGLEPARNRRYLLHWRERFRNGIFGIGGDLTNVVDGVGEIKIIEVPVVGATAKGSDVGRATLTSSPGMRKVVVNVPAGKDMPDVPLNKVKPVAQVRILRSSVIAGSKLEEVKGRPGVARIVAKEGLWEVRRGHKVDGGERRKAEVRSKRRAEERKTSRG